MADAFTNIFDHLPAREGEEFRELATISGVRIERIVSNGDTTPEGEWYDQAWDEWVVVLEGDAEITFAAPGEIVTLSRGDFLLIPAGRRHRVTRTAKPTVWLAIHGPS